MIFDSTPQNLKYLMQNISVARKDQLIKFFSDTDDYVRVEYYIDQYIDKKTFAFNEIRNQVIQKNLARIKNGTVQWNTMFRMNQQEADRRIHAFWILSSVKSKNIKEVIALNYPYQFLFITEDNDIYDITTCYSTTEAQLAAVVRKKESIKGVEDEVNHIVLVNDKALGEKLSEYGFDSYCVLDKDKVPHYYQW